MVAAEQILELFDSYWFETTVLSKKSPLSSSSTSTQNTSPRPQRVNIRSFTDHQTMASTATAATNSSFRKGGGHRKTVKDQSGHKIRPSIELEIRELKGFMDLGFVFSEEDMGSSRLVSLIPGLQKMGRSSKGEEEEDGSVVCRPYLSETRGRSEERKVGKKDINPSFRSTNEIDMKNNLRLWAHSVASLSFQRQA